MKIKKIILAVLLAFVVVPTTFAQQIDEMVYKEVIRYGEKVSRWLLCKSITIYDRRGNPVYYEDAPHTYKYEYDFDSKGNVIHVKGGFTEEWYEYNSKGLCVHKDADRNYFYEYDESGKLTLERYSWKYGNCKTYYKYNESGKLVSSESEYIIGTGSNSFVQKWKIEYDKYGNEIRYYSPDRDESHYYEYDEYDNIIHDIRYDTKTKHINWECWNDYEYWENGIPKKKVLYETYYYY